MARVIFVCDGCDKREDGFFGRSANALKPPSWFVRADDDGVQLACSRPCIDKVASKSGKTAVVMPV